MGDTGFRKRDILKAALLAAFGAPVLAQDQGVFGIKVPKQLMQFIPAKPLNIALTVEAIIRMEKEADLLARDLLRRAGYDPQAAAGFWQRYAAARPNRPRPRWLSAHPSDNARVQYLLP